MFESLEDLILSFGPMYNSGKKCVKLVSKKVCIHKDENFLISQQPRGGRAVAGHSKVGNSFTGLERLSHQ